MKIRAKAALSAAGIMLVAAGAAGCGGGDGGSASDSPKSASKSDFCSAFQTFETDLTKIDPSADPSSIVKTFKSEATKLRSVGTPDDITSSERAGYEAVLDAIDKLPSDASIADISKMESSLSDADKKNAASFQTYLEKECPDLSTGS